MKIGKALHKFFDVYCSAEKLEWIIQELSRLIQENTISGRLCLSVHPLDFLSLSENQHKWRSCHALDGEYRGGNLSYMCDEVTVITYLKSKEDTILPHFPSDVPWNNKSYSIQITVPPLATVYIQLKKERPLKGKTVSEKQEIVEAEVVEPKAEEKKKSTRTKKTTAKKTAEEKKPAEKKAVAKKPAAKKTATKTTAKTTAKKTTAKAKTAKTAAKAVPEATEGETKPKRRGRPPKKKPEA